METSQATPWGQDGPEELDPVDGIIAELRDTERDAECDGETYIRGLLILRQRAGYTAEGRRT